jgi:hypothetical protein
VPPAFFVVAAIALGCVGTEEDISATAAPTTTGIPIGAPGAVGARVEPNVAVAIPPREPSTNGIEEKIEPGPGHDPVIPPSPFGSPQDDDPPPLTPKKKPKGTKI